MATWPFSCFYDTQIQLLNSPCNCTNLYLGTSCLPVFSSSGSPILITHLVLTKQLWCASAALYLVRKLKCMYSPAFKGFIFHITIPFLQMLQICKIHLLSRFQLGIVSLGLFLHAALLPPEDFLMHINLL